MNEAVEISAPAAPVAAPAPESAWSSWRIRGWNALWTCSASAPILLARWLTPSANGMGTHQQLGLPPCTFLWMTGFPCPFCGMTTSWSLAAHLEIGRSIANQPAGFALFVVTLAFVPWLLVEVVRGRRAFRPDDVLARIPPRGWYAVFAVIALAWAYKIALVRGWIA